MDKIKKFIYGNREPAYSDRLPTQLLLICRALVGGYVIYLASGVVQGLSNTKSTKEFALFLGAVIIFVVFGVIFIFDSARNYYIGRYVGGKLDLGEKPSENLYNDAASDVVESQAVEVPDSQTVEVSEEHTEEQA